MTHRFVKLALVSAALGLAGTGMARADCESDMVQLEKAYNAPNLTPAAKTALDDAKTRSVAAMKKDDDSGCHKAIAEAFSKAGMALK